MSFNLIYLFKIYMAGIQCQKSIYVLSLLDYFLTSKMRKHLLQETALKMFLSDNCFRNLANDA